MVDSFHVIASKRLGGAELFFVRLVEALNESGHEAAAVIRHRCAIAGKLQDKIRRIHIPMVNNLDVFSVLKLRTSIKKEGPAIVQTYMGRATRLTRIAPGKGVIHIARLGGFYKIKGYYQHAHAWVGNTRSVCDYMIREGLPADRIYFIGNFVDIPERTPVERLAALRRSLNIPEDAVIIFSLARFIRKKGIDDLLAAFSKIPAQLHQRPLCLVIAGDGPAKDALKRLEIILGLKGRVFWVGWQNRPDPYFDLADVFVCPSKHEPLGNVILEAWSHKLPVVTTRTDGARELIMDGYNGILTPEANPQRLSERLLELLESGREGWNRIGSNGMNSLAANHSKSNIVKSYLDLYDKLQKHG